MENRVLVLPHLGAGVAHFAFYVYKFAVLLKPLVENMEKG